MKQSGTMKTLWSLMLCACALSPLLPATAPAQDIVIRMGRQEKKKVSLDWIFDHKDIWSVSQDEFEKKIGKRKFVWQDKDRTRARFDPEEYDFEVHEEKVGETLVTFAGGKVSSITISVLNKGDDSEIGRSAYEEAMKKMRSALDGVTGVKSEPRPKNDAVTKAEGVLWRSTSGLYLLEGLFLPETKEVDGGWIITTPAHAEFVRVRILPAQKQLGTGVPQVKTTQSRAILAERVKRENIDPKTKRASKVYIDGIPMVDQGAKGYCAVASFERVLRYYGADIDMHDLANLANTYGGTNPREMKNSVEKIAKKLGMATREPMLMIEVKQYLKFIADYNRAAKKAKTDTVPETWGFWQNMDAETVKAMRTSTQDFTKFKQEVVTNINKGVPIMWALHLGLFWEEKIEESFEANRYATTTEETETDKEDEEYVKKEAERRAKEMEELRKKEKRPPSYMQGGHMRLIIGYDIAENALYYTDSWGPGHEMKKMKLEEAFAGTMALMILEPR